MWWNVRTRQKESDWRLLELTRCKVCILTLFWHNTKQAFTLSPYHSYTALTQNQAIIYTLTLPFWAVFLHCSDTKPCKHLHSHLTIRTLLWHNTKQAFTLSPYHSELYSYTALTQNQAIIYTLNLPFWHKLSC